MPVTITGPDQQPPGRATVYDEPPSERSVERRTVSPRPEREPHEEKVTTATLTGGSTLELIGGGGAVVLAIIGLTGFLPMYMTAIATIDPLKADCLVAIQVPRSSSPGGTSESTTAASFAS